MFSVTAVAPVYNVEKFIEKSITSVVKQSYKVEEIFILDDGSTDSSIEKIMAIAKKSKVPIKIFRMKHVGMRGKLINSILPKIKSDVIWIVETDAHYDADYLKNSMKHFKDPKVCGTIGRIHCWEVKSFLDKCREVELAARYRNYKPFTVWVIRTSTFRELGGFDERVWFFDDAMFGKVAKENGYKLVFEPKALWYHNEKSSLRIIARQRLKWGYAYLLTLRHYRWFPLYIPLWTAAVAIFGFAIAGNFLSQFLAAGATLFAAYIFYMAKDVLKVNKNPVYPVAITSIKLYKQFVTMLTFWLGLLFRAFGKNIL